MNSKLKKIFSIIVSIVFAFFMICNTTIMPSEASQVYVVDAFNETFTRSDGYYTVNCRLPKLLLDGNDALEANKSIINRFQNSIDESRSGYDMHEISYSYSVNNGILSLVIKDHLVPSTAHYEFLVYNFNLSTNSKISREEFLKQNNFDWNKIVEIIKGIYKKNLPKWNQSGTTDQRYYNDSISDSYINQTELYLENGKLYAICYWHSLAGSGGSGRYDSFEISGDVLTEINCGLDIKWGRDNFSFENDINDLPLKSIGNNSFDYDMDYSLFNHLSFLPSDILAMKKNLQPCGGVCFGMSVMTYRNATGLLDVSSLQTGKTNLYQLSKPKDAGTEKLRNAIGLYQASCASSKYQSARDSFINLSVHEKLSILYNKLIDIENTNRPIVLDYAWISDEDAHNNSEDDGVSAHAVLAYGIENEYAPYIINDKKYEYKVWIINPNNSFSSETDISYASQYCMYIDGDLNEFCIPVGGTRKDSQSKYSLISTTGEMSKLGDVNLQFATDDYSLLPSTESDTSKIIVESSSQSAIINGKMVSGYKGNDNSISSRAFSPSGENANMSLVLNANTNPTIQTVNNNQTIGVLNNSESFFVNANKNSTISINNGEYDFSNSYGEYQVELSSNYTENKCQDIQITGTGKQDLSFNFAYYGLHLSGNDLNGITISNDNDSITLSTNETELVIKEEKEELIAEVPNKIIGDVDGDATVTIIDATFIQRKLASIPIPFSIINDIADTDGDGSVTIIDATFIQRFLASLTDHFYQPEKVSLNTTEKALNVGEKFTLIPTITPADATNKSITWSSSDSSIATVSNGVVTAKAAGTATITATTHNGKTAKCSITVISKPTSISLNKTEVTLHVDESVQLSATLKPSGITDTISWSSQYNSFASVSNNGCVYANHVGNTTITARTSNGLTATCNVHIIPRTPSVVLLDKENLSLDKGDGYQLHASVSPSDADQTITWSSSDTSIATVNPSGYITTIKSGQVNITAKASNGVSKTCKVEVYQPISGYLALVLFTKNEPNGCARITKDFTVNLLINDTDTTAFCGIINGDFHTITYSYEYKTKDIAGDCYKALIPKTDGALIKNITVSGDFDHDFYPTASNKSYCAGVVAYAKNTIFENCSNQAKIENAIMGSNSGYAYTGGITAWGDNCVFKDCKNSGNILTVSMPSKVSASVAGGIVGVINGGSIERCISTGGIGTHATNSSSIYYTIAYSGGIVGQSYSATINSCSSSGNVNANSWPDQETQYKSVAATGGIVGAGTANILNSASTCILRPSGIRGSENYSNELIGYEFS